MSFIVFRTFLASPYQIVYVIVVFFYSFFILLCKRTFWIPNRSKFFFVDRRWVQLLRIGSIGFPILFRGVSILIGNLERKFGRKLMVNAIITPRRMNLKRHILELKMLSIFIRKHMGISGRPYWLHEFYGWPVWHVWKINDAPL